MDSTMKGPLILKAAALLYLIWDKSIHFPVIWNNVQQNWLLKCFRKPLLDALKTFPMQQTGSWCEACGNIEFSVAEGGWAYLFSVILIKRISLLCYLDLLCIFSLSALRWQSSLALHRDMWDMKKAVSWPSCWGRVLTLLSCLMKWIRPTPMSSPSCCSSLMRRAHSFLRPSCASLW